MVVVVDFGNSQPAYLWLTITTVANKQHLELIRSSVAEWNHFIASSQPAGFRADLSGARLIGAELAGANLTGANLTKAKLNRAILFEANLTGANLTKANLSVAHLTKANLTKANLTKANLTKANLFGANLIVANLTGANLTKADLFGAHLSVAHLSGANLFEANLTKANLSVANLSGANLSGAILARAVWNEWTTWPDGFRPPIQTGQAIRVSSGSSSQSRNRRFRVSIDVGPSASFEELSQILTDLGLLSQVAASWATLEQELSESGESGDVIVKAPPKTGLGSEVPSIVSVSYRNPVDVEVAGVAVVALIALLRVIPQCKKDLAEARKSNAEAAILEDQLRNQTAATAEFKATPEQIIELFKFIASSLQAVVRLSQYEIEVSEVEPDPDEDPE